MFLEVFSLGGRYPGLITLVQLILFGVLLVYGTRVLVQAGVPAWVAVGAAWLLGLSPAIAPTTLTLWKDIPFGLAFLWAWIELLALTMGPPPETPGTGWAAIRLGIALAGLWLFRGNGPITVVLVILVMVVWLARRDWRVPMITGAVAAVVVFLVTGPLYASAEVIPNAAVPAEVFLPDVAASYVSEPETFTAADVDMLDDVAPLQVWTARYDCDESTPLLFDPAFDHQPVRAEPMKWLELEFDVLVRDPDSVLEHRACSSSYLYLPQTPDDTFLHTPPYAIPENEVGLVREPISDIAFAVTDWYWKWAEDYPWLTWRPAIVIWPALAAIVVFAFGARRFLIPSTLFLAHLANVTLTSPAQEFRYAYPLYLVAVFTVTLLWPALRSDSPVDQEGTSRRPSASSLSKSGATVRSQDSSSA
jgi:hypothetical protein